MAVEDQGHAETAQAKMSSEQIVPDIVGTAQLIAQLGRRTVEIQRMLGADGAPRLAGAWQQLADAVSIVMPTIAGVHYVQPAGSTATAETEALDKNE